MKHPKYLLFAEGDGWENAASLWIRGEEEGQPYTRSQLSQSQEEQNPEHPDISRCAEVVHVFT